MANRNPLSFIVDLLNNPGVSLADRQRIKKLASKTQYIVGESNTSIESLDNESSFVSEIQGKHYPLELVSFLKLFSALNSALKYSTHPWDDKADFASFGAFVEQYKLQLNTNPYWKYGWSKDGKSKIATCNQRLYSTINLYLQSTDISNYTWGKDRIKVGLLTNGVVSSWLDKNPEKKFYEMPVSEYHEAVALGKDAKLFNFNDIVNAFKKSIEFRDKNLFNTVRRESSSPDVKVDNEKLKTLMSVSCYTDTFAVSEAIKKIIFNVKGRTDDTKLDIWADEVSDKNLKYCDIHFLHIDSFSDKSIDDPKLKLESGGLLDIKNHLTGLCDFYIKSRFLINGELSFARIDYLTYDDSTGLKRTVTPIESMNGFEYVIRFYL